MTFRANRKYTVAAAIGLCALASTEQAGADVTFFKTRYAFQQAATDLTTLTFDNAQTGFYPGGYGEAGVFFTGIDVLNVHDASLNGSQFLFGGSDLRNPNSGADSIVAYLPAGTTAVGTDMFSFASIPPASSIRVTLSTGDVYYGDGFAGFVSDTPITSIAFYSVGGNEPATAIDNFTFGHSAATPAPGALWTILLGAVPGAALVVRRKKMQSRTGK